MNTHNRLTALESALSPTPGACSECDNRDEFSMRLLQITPDSPPDASPVIQGCPACGRVIGIFHPITLDGDKTARSDE
jgi:hypothetical protein